MAQADLEVLYRGYGLDALLAGVPEQGYPFWGMSLNREASGVLAQGDKLRAQLLSLLAAVSLVYVDGNSPTHSFDRMFLGEDRLVTPAELTAKEVEQLRAAAEVIQTAPFRARLLDMLWHSRGNFRDCVAAVAAYLDSADSDATASVEVTQRYERGVGLALGLGRKQKPFKDAVGRLLARTQDAADSETQGYFFLRLVKTVEKYAPGKSKPFVGKILARADAAVARGDHYEAEKYLQTAVSLLKGWGDETGVRGARLKLGECFVQMAEQMAAAIPANFIGATTWMARGIEELQRGGEPTVRLSALRARLAEMQQASLGELQAFEFPEDLAKEWENEMEANQEVVRKAISGRSFRDALITLATQLPFCQASQVRQQVIDLAQDAPLSNMFASRQLDKRGRTVAVDPGLPPGQEDPEAAILLKMFLHARQWIWGPRADLVVAGAQSLLEEHRPTVEDLSFLVRSTPAVAEGHEPIVLRGLYAGLYGDWLLATHLLVPQFEASLRHLLEASGAVVAKLEEGVEEDQTLGALLNRKECADVIGPDWQFELRGILTEKTGLNFRNDLAHGLLTNGQCNSVAGVNAWWLMLRLCVVMDPPPVQKFGDDAGVPPGRSNFHPI